MRDKYGFVKIFFVLLIVSISIGYAYLNANLNIDGTADIVGSNWNIHWDNVQVSSGSVTAATPTIDVNGTTVSYTITLNEPGDFYEFTIDAVNSGTLDGMISSITSTLDNEEIITLPDYLDYAVTYVDGTEVATNQLLAAGTSEKYKVRIEYKGDISADDLPEADQELHLSFGVTYVQANENAVPVSIPPVSFSTDSWSTIVGAARSGNTSVYNVGDTKSVDLGSLGTHTLRISNISTPSECSSPTFSQTACGIVIEFADIITLNEMKTDGSNIGGWENSIIRSYVNNTIYNSLPDDLKNSIIDTRAISGHGSGDSANIVTTDKLYLLSAREIFCDFDSGPTYDTAWNNTRELDYYKNLVALDNYQYLIKKYNNVDTDWWTRTPVYYELSDDFVYVEEFGAPTFGDNPDSDKGVSPAFRIG